MRKVDHDDRRREIAAEAAKLIAEQGMEKLTTRALAAQMGCSIGVLSHYFNSKEGIVLAAFNWADSQIDQRMADIFNQGVADGLELEQFIPVIRAGLPLDEETDLQWRVRFNLYSYSLTNTSEKLPQQTEKLWEFRQSISGLITEYQRQGKIRDDMEAEAITNLAFDLVIGAAQNLLMVPMEQRESYVQPLLGLVEMLRP